MLILNPTHVTFAGTQWPDVTAVVIDRDAIRAAISYGDHGPHPTFADVPEQRTTLEVTMDLPRGDLSTARPGDQGTLTLYTSPTSSDAQRRKLTATGVVTNVQHKVGDKSATRTITLVALSTDGATDPISLTDA